MNKYYGFKPGTVRSQELDHTAIVRNAAASLQNKERRKKHEETTDF